jgi:hypothetical protein
VSVKRLEVVIAGIRKEIASLAPSARVDPEARKDVLTLRKHIKEVTRLKKRYAERDAKQG